jgi:ribosomal-protein-alanine N-acetyltransferase
LSTSDASVRLAVMSEADAREIAAWRYDQPYDLYDGSEAEVAVMTDPVNRYRSLRRDGELIGYACVGEDALVAGQASEPDVDDIGLGFRPDQIGRGQARTVLPEVLALLGEELTAPRQRVVIAQWNQRAISAARAVGFEPEGVHSNDAGDWVVLTRTKS